MTCKLNNEKVEMKINLRRFKGFYSTNFSLDLFKEWFRTEVYGIISNSSLDEISKFFAISDWLFFPAQTVDESSCCNVML